MACCTVELQRPLSLLTAALLKGVLEVVVLANNWVKSRFRQASTPFGKVMADLLLWVVLFGSKFLVLEAVDFVFGSRVSLGGFFSVTLLILVLLLARGRSPQTPSTRAGEGDTRLTEQRVAQACHALKVPCPGGLIRHRQSESHCSTKGPHLKPRAHRLGLFRARLGTLASPNETQPGRWLGLARRFRTL